MKSKLFAFVLAWASLFVATHQVAAQSTAFTYQGRLTDGTNPANGTYDLQFTIYDAPTDGVAQSGPITNAATILSNGVFAVTLDFGASVFNGADRWLEIGVRTNGAASFTALGPRQQLTAAPYALTAANVAGVIPSGSLSGLYSNALTFNNAANVFAGSLFAGSFNGDGSGLNSLNASQLSSGTVPDTRLPADLARTNRVWLVGGNAGTAPANGNFIGSTDNQPLELRVQGRRALRVEPATNANPNYSFAPNIIGGHESNSIAPNVIGATIAGGGRFGSIDGDLSHRITAHHGTIGGGDRNTVSGEDGTIAGGGGHSVRGPYSSIGGGLFNTAHSNAWYVTIAGGAFNAIGTNSSSTTISGGYANTIKENTLDGTIGGGSFAVIGTNSAYSTIGGGRQNTVSDNASSATIAGGNQNIIRANAAYATIPGGYGNIAAGQYSFAAGYQGRANHDGAFVWSDASSATPFASTGSNQFVVRANGGVRFVTGSGGVTFDGQPPLTTQTISNAVWLLNGNAGTSPTNGSFLGTTENQPLELKVWGRRGFRIEPATNADPIFNFAPNIIGGHESNSIAPGIVGATIAGGGRIEVGGQDLTHHINAHHGTIGGGDRNTVNGLDGTIAGGGGNFVAGAYSTVAGGLFNFVSSNSPASRGDGASVVGGYFNNSSGNYASIGGGIQNASSAENATVAGGGSNRASGHAATVPGGQQNTAAGNYSFAAGYRAAANHAGAFVWADSVDAAFASTANNQFLIRAAGGVGIGTNNPQSMLHVVRDWDGENGALRLTGDRPTIRFDGGAVAGNQTWLAHVGSDGPGNLAFYRRVGPGGYQNTMSIATNGSVGILGGGSTLTRAIQIPAQLPMA